MADFSDQISYARLVMQSLLMGAGTSPVELMKASVFKAIKSVDNGGPKPKHTAYAMKVLNENINPSERLHDILIVLSAINFYKDPVLSIRIVVFLIEMYVNGAKFKEHVGLADQSYDLTIFLFE